MCLCEEQQGHQPKELICQRGQHLPALGSSLHTSRVRSWPPAAGVGLVGLSSRLGWWVLCTCAEHRAELSGWPCASLSAFLCTHHNVDLVTVFILGGFFVPVPTSSRTVFRKPAIGNCYVLLSGQAPIPNTMCPFCAPVCQLFCCIFSP